MPISLSEVPSQNLIPTSQSRLKPENMFSASRAEHPHMRNHQSRLVSFTTFDSQWPHHRVRASPNEMAEAGLFYVGVRDRVKCWFCNGGLQNWDENDQPWVEHAKWYPRCEFVLQRKGHEFVDSVRHRVNNPINNTTTSGLNYIQREPTHPTNHYDVNREQRSYFHHHPTTVFQHWHPPQTTIRSSSGFQEEQTDTHMGRTQYNRVEDFMRTSDFVRSVREMGFEENIISRAVQRQFEESDAGFATLEDILDAIVPLTSNQSLSNQATEIEEISDREMSGESSSSLSSVEELRSLREARVCKRCRREPISVVFLPCGHLHCCTRCAPSCGRCPVCASAISERVRSFIV